MLSTELRASRGEGQQNLFEGLAEPGYFPVGETEREGLKVKYVEFSVLDLIYNVPHWPGRDLLLEAAMNTDVDEDTTLIFVGTGKAGEKHSNIVAGALGIEAARAVTYRCVNAGRMEFHEGKWIVGGCSFGLVHRSGRDVQEIRTMEKMGMDSKTAAKLQDIYGEDRQFEPDVVE